MYVQFYQHMQSAEYRQDLELKIAVETVRIIIICYQMLYCIDLYWFYITHCCVRWRIALLLSVNAVDDSLSCYMSDKKLSLIHI